MKEKTIIRLSILVFWTFFWGLSVMDKIIPDVHHLWVGKDFFALFVKFFGSLGFFSGALHYDFFEHSIVFNGALKCFLEHYFFLEQFIIFLEHSIYFLMHLQN